MTKDPSGTLCGNSTKFPDKLLLFLSLHHHWWSRFHQSTKAKPSAFDGTSSVLEIYSLYAQWAQNQKGQTVQVLACWNGPRGFYSLLSLLLKLYRAHHSSLDVLVSDTEPRLDTLFPLSHCEEYWVHTKQAEQDREPSFGSWNHKTSI